MTNEIISVIIQTIVVIIEWLLEGIKEEKEMKKRILSFAIALTMAVSLSACGSKDDVKAGNKVTVTMDEIQEKMTSAMDGVKSVDLNLEAAFDMQMEAMGEKASVKADADAEGSVVIGTPGAHLKGSASYSMEAPGEDDQKGDYSGEAYVVTDDTSATAYFTSDGKEWKTSTITKEEFQKEFEDALSSMGDLNLPGETGEGTDAPETQAKLADKTVEAAGKECYEISATVDKSELSSLPGMEQYASALEMFGAFEVKAAIYVDVDSYRPVKMEITADMQADDETSGMSLDLKKCELSVELEYDKTEKIEVPDSVKSSAVSED